MDGKGQAMKRPKYRDCVVCGEQFEVVFRQNTNAITCSDECSAARRKHTHDRWHGENREHDRQRARAYRAANLEHVRAINRQRQRRIRGTDPADYAENRDPEAIKQRERERWRRGQAARRARLLEAANAD
jgi:hypothetical protein